MKGIIYFTLPEICLLHNFDRKAPGTLWLWVCVGSKTFQGSLEEKKSPPKYVIEP